MSHTATLPAGCEAGWHGKQLMQQGWRGLGMKRERSYSLACVIRPAYGRMDGSFPSACAEWGSKWGNHEILLLPGGCSGR
jgi:hypothetical protein